jgi:hypothetical protein
VQRYSGGRIGPTPPPATSSDRLFNDSGRFAKSIFARAGKTGEFVISWAANRFSGHVADQVPGWLIRLRQLVPVLQSPAELGKDPAVRAAVQKAMAGAIGKASDKGRAAGLRLISQARDLAASARDVAEAAED